jgi:hypothetical protein
MDGSVKHRTIIILEHDTPHPDVRFGPDVTCHVAGVLREQDFEDIEGRVIRPMMDSLARFPRRAKS